MANDLLPDRGRSLPGRLLRLQARNTASTSRQSGAGVLRLPVLLGRLVAVLGVACGVEVLPVAHRQQLEELAVWIANEDPDADVGVGEHLAAVFGDPYAHLVDVVD